MSLQLARYPARLAALPVWLDRERALQLAVAAILLLTSAIRVSVGAGEPLWLDETWTGLHASQSSFSAFLNEVRVDINAPLYYCFAWAWAGVFGLSNEALRWPSALFGLTFPLLALLPNRELDRTTRLVWCALLATWTPGLWQSQEARCYTMLLALSTSGALLYARLLTTPTLARAFAWSSVGALAILTHYYAAILFGCQGIGYLMLRRTQAVRTWPAALAFVPAFGWMALNLPQLAGFALVNWFSTLSFIVLPWIFDYALGPAVLIVAVLSLGIPGSAFGLIGRSRRSSEAGSVLPWVVGTGCVGAIMLVTAGFLRPVFTHRYLTIFEPYFFLGLALWIRSISDKRPFAPVALVLCLAFTTASLALRSDPTHARVLNFEIASTALMKAGIRRLAFTWDNPSVRGLSPDKLGELGAFFFKRAGYEVDTRGVVLEPGDDPNRRLLAYAAEPRSAILWIYDLGVEGTAAAAHPPSIASLDPSWNCRDYGRASIGVVTCLRSD